MKNFVSPVTVVDDFFDNPQWVRDFALQQEFKPDPNNVWPGKRTELLERINKPLFDHTINRFLSLFYDFKVTDVNWHATASFQLVDQRYDHGWVHRDMELITGIIYLNENTVINSGTTIYESKVEGTRLLNQTEKMKSFSQPDNAKDFENYRKENNNQFTESVVVKNKFNRLVSFDSHLYHAGNDYFGDKDTGRLTLVFFIDRLTAKEYPLQRLKKV